MSVHGDICDILDDANVAAGGAHSEFLDADSDATEYVILKCIDRDPQMTLIGYGGLTHYTFMLLCWCKRPGGGKARAIEIADAAVAALDAAAAADRDDSPPGPYGIMQQEQPALNEEFTPDIMAMMEPRQYSVWLP